MKRTNIAISEKRLFTWVPEETHRQAKASAALSGKTLDEWVKEAVDCYLDAQNAPGADEQEGEG